MEEWESTSTFDEDGKNQLYSASLSESRFWIQRVLLPLVVSVGILGNALTVVVLTRRRMRSSTNTYLTALAVSDLLYLVFVFTLSLEHYPGSHTKAFYYYWVFYRFGLWLTDATTCVSTWLTVTFTVERYIAVCHPIRGKILCTESRARVAITIVYVMCFLSTMTTPMEWELDFKEGAGTEAIIYVGQRPTKLAVDSTYTAAFYWFWSVTFVFLPLLLLGIFNSFLIAAVHKSRKARRRMTQTQNRSNAQKQENKITTTLIAVVILFVFCQLPTAILLIMKSVHNPPDNSNSDKLFRVLGNIFNFLVTLNASCNFMLYCAFSAKYRKTLFATFVGKCASVSPQLHSTIPETSISRSTLREKKLNCKMIDERVRTQLGKEGNVSAGEQAKKPDK